MSDVDNKLTVKTESEVNPPNLARERVNLVVRKLVSAPMVWALVGLAAVSQILYPGFLEVQNLQNVLVQNAPIGIVAIGMTFVIIAGGFDLSVGAIFAMGAVVFASFVNKYDSVLIALAGACAAGILVGALNGAVITKARINPFVATLGSASVISGLTYTYANSQPILIESDRGNVLGSGDVAGVPTAIVLLALAFAIGGLVLAKTVYGRVIYIVGGNREAGRLAGLRVDLVQASTYMVTGICAAVAGAIMASRTLVGQGDMGTTIPLDAIAIVVIGGTALMGGEGSIWRTAVGLGILATMNNLFNSLAWDSATQSIVKGLVIILAVAGAGFSRRKR